MARRSTIATLNRLRLTAATTSRVSPSSCNYRPTLTRANPNIFLNAAGGPGLETLLPAFWTGCVERGLPLSRVALLLAKGPAAHFGLANKGQLAPGYDADIAVLEPGAFVYDPSASFSAVNWSAYDGRVMAAKVVATFLRGEPAFMDGKIKTKPGDGKFLHPLGLRQV